jgi:MFS family permease
MAVKRYGPNNVLALALVLWSVVTLGTGFVKTYEQAIVLRLLLGACEAGVAPSFAFLFATIYPRGQTAKRLMMGNLSNAVSGAFGGLFAYAIQTMGTRRGLSAWRWLFIIEGCLTFVVGAFCWYLLPSSPDDAWFLNAEEKACMVMRKQRDIIYRGDGDDSKAKWVKLAFKDPLIYLAGIAFFTSSVAIFGFSTFLPTIIKGLGYKALHVNYMTIPIYVVGAVSLVLQVWLSDKIQQRALFLVLSTIPVMAGYLICVGTANAVAGYIAMFILACGVYSISTLLVTWIATSLSNDTKRSVALPVFYSIGNLSGLVSSQLYPSQQGPRYVMGNAISAGLEFVAALLFISVWLLLRRRNQQKQELIAKGAKTNGKEGDQALDFVYPL